MAEDVRSKVFSAITGLDADVSGTGTDLRRMLIAAYGASARTKSGVDVKAAAKGLGVTTRTVQRWLAPEGQERQSPRKDRLAKIRSRSRQAATTKRGRARMVAAAKITAPKRDRRVTVSSVQGPFGRGQLDYKRIRETDAVLSPAQYDAMLQAYEEGGEQGALDFLQTGWADWYLGNPTEKWEFDVGETEPEEFGIYVE